MSEARTSLNPMDQPDVIVVPGTTGDSTGQAGVLHGSEGNGGQIEKPVEDNNMIAINTNLGPAYITTAGGTMAAATSEDAKSDQSEMVFTVVAMDGTGLPFNNDQIPKEVQLSLMPTVTEGVSGVNTGDMHQYAAQNAGLFNQLALIASAMPPSATEAPPAQPEQAPQLATTTDHHNNHHLQQDSNHHDNDDETRQRLTPPKKVVHPRKTPEKYHTTTTDENGRRTRVKCNVCDQDFSDLPSMRRHSLIHSNEKPFQCDFCDKAFRRKDNLREHRNIHTQETVYACERCGKTFPRKYTHKVHMTKFCSREKLGADTGDQEQSGMESDGEHGRSSEPTCMAVSRIPSRELLLRSPNTKCSDPCSICHKTFRDTSTLKRHLLTHSDERPFKCNDCNKAFRRKDHLMEHVIVHKEIRPFTCHDCGKSFSRKTGLKTHLMRTSHGTHKVSDPLNEIRALGNRLDPDHDMEHVLTSATGPFLKHITIENEVPNEDDGDDAILATHARGNGTHTSAPIASGSVEIISENTQNSGGNFAIGNADAAIDTETTVVLAEKSCGDALPEIGEGEGDVSPQKAGSGFMEIGSGENSGRGGNLWVYAEGMSAGQGSGGALRCPNCPNVFSDKEGLWEHFQEHLSEELFGCEHCFATFTMPEHVEEHQKTCVHAAGILEDSEGHDDGGEVITSRDNTTSDAERVAMETEVSDDDDGMVGGNKGPRNCPVCKKSFRDTTALKRHSLVHSGERPHSCDQCGKRFRRRDHLKSHVTAYHLVSASFQCKTCNEVFDTRYCLTTHTKSCRKPTTPTRTTATMIKPAQPVTPESVSCPICEKPFKDSSSQRRHLRTHSDERPFQCTICTKSFRRKDNLKEHMLCHSDHKPFSCEDCGKALSRRSSLTNHRTICNMRRVSTSMTAATDAGNPQMPQNTIVTIPNNLVTLTAAHDSMEVDQAAQAIAATLPEIEPLTGNHPTIQANQALAENPTLSGNQTLPENTILPENTTLPENTALAGNTALQENTTLPENRSLPPENRSQTFTTDAPSGTLDMPASGVPHEAGSSGTIGDMHEETGTEEDDQLGDGERGFGCDICGKIFRAKWTLKYHQRVHTGAKPYTCQTCDRHFRQPSHLKIHMRTHSGERPYVCEACGRAFIDSSTMRRHARIHKDGGQYSDVIEDNPSAVENPGQIPATARCAADATDHVSIIHDVRGGSDQSGTNVEGETERMQEIAGDGTDTTSLISESSAQPISTVSTQAAMSQSEAGNIVHVVGQLSSSGDQGTTQANGGVVARKVETLSDVQWQGANAVVQDNMGQMTYYIVSDEM